MCVYIVTSICKYLKITVFFSNISIFYSHIIVYCFYYISILKTHEKLFKMLRYCIGKKYFLQVTYNVSCKSLGWSCLKDSTGNTVLCKVFNINCEILIDMLIEQIPFVISFRIRKVKIENLLKDNRWNNFVIHIYIYTIIYNVSLEIILN